MKEAMEENVFRVNGTKYTCCAGLACKSCIHVVQVSFHAMGGIPW